MMRRLGMPKGALRRASLCATALLAIGGTAHAVSEPPHSAELDAAIIRQAKIHGVPEKLVRRIVMRESKYNARAHNRSFWGLMQISYPTAKSMGFRGKPSDLLDPFVNLTYAVPYLANAFLIAGHEEDAAVRLYASGYYRTAKSKGLLGELRTAESDPLVPGTTLLAATTRPIANFATAVANTPSARQIVEASNDAQVQAAQAATAQPAASAQPAGATGGGTDHDKVVMMVREKNGLAPPRKWTKDGGTTIIMRGEQRVEQVAAYQHNNAPPAPMAETKTSRHSIIKAAYYAQLDPPGTQPQQRPQQQPAGLPLFQAYSEQPAPAAAFPPMITQPGLAQPGLAQAGSVQPAAMEPAPALRGTSEPVAGAAPEASERSGSSVQAKSSDAGKEPAGHAKVAAKPAAKKNASTKAASKATTKSVTPVQLHKDAADKGAHKHMTVAKGESEK